MSVVTEPLADPEGRFSREEWELRVELAACYQLLAKFRMTDLTGTHASARIPGEPEHFLLNPYGLLFHEITASSLVKFDLDGNVLSEGPRGLNPAGFAIHGAIHKARHDVGCVIHTHTKAGTAVAALECGLLPVNQKSLIFYNRVAYNDYVLLTHIDQCAKLVEDLGDKIAMIMRNHGLVTVGRNIGEAFIFMFHLDKACEMQLEAMSSGAELILPPPDVCEDAARREMGWDGNPFGKLDWEALVRDLDRENSFYKT